MSKRNVILSIITASLIFTGCGGGGGGSSTSSNTNTTKTISGVVSDPEIKNAQVSLCEKSDITNCLSVTNTTNENGVYTLNVDKELDLSDYFIIAKNGVDTKTGMDFTGFTFKAPANMPKDDKNRLVISPLTTLVAEANEDGDTLDDAITKVANNLNLDKSKIKMNPSEDKDVQKAAILLSSIVEVANKSFDDINTQNQDLDTYIDSISTQSLKNELKATKEVLENQNDMNMMLKTFVSFKELLNTDEINAYDKNNEVLFTNLVRTARKVSHALENYNDIDFTRIRKVITNADTDDLLNENKVIADINTENLDLETTSLQIKNAKEALENKISSSDEIRDYYYSLDISYTNKAQEVIKDIKDISFTDEVYLGIAKTFVENDDISKAKYYLNNLVFKTSTKKSLKLAIADKLVLSDEQGKKDEAKKLYLEVFETIKELYLTKKIDTLAVVDLKALLEGFSALLDEDNVNAVNDYIVSKKAELTSFRYYTDIINGLREATDAQIKKNVAKEEIEKTIDLAYEWSLQIPGDLFKLIYLTISVADRYTQIESFDKAKQVADDIVRIREANAKLSSAYAVDAIEYYVNAGDFQSAEATIKTISDDRNREKAYLKYALAVYANDGIDKALEFINTNITDLSIKRDVLTQHGIAKYAIEQNNYDDAKRAIQEAVKILDSEFANANETGSNVLVFASNYIQLGYIRYAKLYEQMNEDVLRDEMIAKAEKFFEKFNTFEFTQSYTYLINTYARNGDFEKAKELINKAITQFVPTANNIGLKIESYNYIISLLEYKQDIDITSNIDEFAKLIKDNENIYAVVDNDSGPEAQKSKRIMYFNKIAGFYAAYDLKDKVLESLNEATKIANTLANIQEKYKQILTLVEEYAKYTFVDEAIKIANNIEYRNESKKALTSIAESIKNYDAFPNVEGATVDFDNDGKVDFYDYGYDSSSVNIPLDDDLDNDGIPNDQDSTPYFNAQ